jgi:AcrR family transcriptional regulator
MQADTQDSGQQRYRSALRERHTADTRELIITAVGEQLAAGGVDDLSVDRVAERAGVSPRTVYRHFPTRDALLDALGTWVTSRTRELPDPLRAEDLPGAIVESFESFDRHETMMRGFLATSGGRELRAHLRRKRLRRICAALEEPLRGVDPERARATSAVIAVLCSAATWQTLKDEAGLTGHQAGVAVADAIAGLLDAARRDHTPEQGDRTQ